ncbi:hypothetical protein MAR_003066 [Mya arenaria]|uniref:Chromo domain-containing protein n=1 Tax=Mya arenaria TaxID=6604 RepID=A0ABY7G8J4_MYAAR|nr:hypothetical protein MAR_003066 [Mya arenaria]
MREYDVRFFSDPKQNKASTSERAILTIKRRLYRYFTHNDSYSYLPVSQDIAYSYNHTYRRTIGMPPSDVTDTNQEETQNCHLRNVFTRAYDETYTGEIFQIHKRYHRRTLPIYRLRDLQDEEIKGTFYESELQKKNNTFKIDKIEKTKGKGKYKQYFVKWKYYPKQFNSLNNASDFE